MFLHGPSRESFGGGFDGWPLLVLVEWVSMNDRLLGVGVRDGWCRICLFSEDTFFWR